MLATKPPRFTQCLRFRLRQLRFHIIRRLQLQLELMKSHKTLFAASHNKATRLLCGTLAHSEALIVGKSLALIGWDMIVQNDMYDLARRQWKDEITREE